MSSTDTAELGAAAAHATAPPVSEDWLSLAIGLVIFALALFSLWGVDLLGWVVSAAVWADPSLALAPFSKTYADLGGAGAFIVTYLALLCGCLHGRVLDRPCELDRRQQRPSRRRHAGGPATLRYRLVAQAHK
jgi:hypothetical protein